MSPSQAADAGLKILLFVLLALSPVPTASAASAAQPDADLDETMARRIEIAARHTFSGEVDSARERWRRIEADAAEVADLRARAQAREALAELDFMQGRYDSYRANQETRLGEARARGDLGAMSLALMRLGILERRLGHLEQARPLFERALSMRRQLDDPDGEALVLTHIGLVLLNQGDFSGALDALMRSLDLQQSGARAELDRTLHYLGLLYRSLNEFDDAREFLLQGLATAEREPDPMRQAPLLGSLARVSNDSGRHAEALEYTSRSREISSRFDSLPGLAYDALERGRALFGLGRNEEARETLLACIELSRSISQQRTLADAEFTLGRIAIAEGRTAEAIDLIESALPSYVDAADTPQTLEAYRLLIPLLRDRGDLDRALALSESSLRMQDRINSLQTNRRVALIEYAQRSAASERRIELLNRDVEIQTLRLRQERLNRQLGLAVAAGLLLALLALLYRYRQSRRLSASLEASRASLAQAHDALAQRAADLYQASTTDALTGIANRRHLLQRLEEELAAARAQARPLSIVLFDIDHFKRVNDTHGHLTGDAVLERCTRRVQTLCTDDALLGRFGGEEFMLILPDTSAASALAFADRVRRTLAAPGGDGPRVTASLGVACSSAYPDASMEAFIEAADRALYRAKSDGRNRVVLAQHGAVTPVQ